MYANVEQEVELSVWRLSKNSTTFLFSNRSSHDTLAFFKKNAHLHFISTSILIYL